MVVCANFPELNTFTASVVPEIHSTTRCNTGTCWARADDHKEKATLFFSVTDLLLNQKMGGFDQEGSRCIIDMQLGRPIEHHVIRHDTYETSSISIGLWRKDTLDNPRLVFKYQQEWSNWTIWESIWHIMTAIYIYRRICAWNILNECNHWYQSRIFMDFLNLPTIPAVLVRLTHSPAWRIIPVSRW